MPIRPSAPPASAAWRWATLGACAGALLAAVACAPARWLTAVVQQTSEQRVQLQDVRGTVWDGSARLVLTGGAGSRDASALPDRLHWRWGLDWKSLGMGLSLSIPCCTAEPLRWWLQRRDGSWQLNLQDQQSRWPLQVLTGLGAPWNTLQPEGQLVWQSTGIRLRWSGGLLHWQGHNSWQIERLASRLSTLRPMGTYRITLNTPPEGSTHPALTLETLSGPLLLTGHGQWTGQRLRFEGVATAETGHEDALSNLLNIIGRRDGARSRLSLG